MNTQTPSKVTYQKMLWSHRSQTTEAAHCAMKPTIQRFKRKADHLLHEFQLKKSICWLFKQECLARLVTLNSMKYHREIQCELWMDFLLHKTVAQCISYDYLGHNWALQGCQTWILSFRYFFNGGVILFIVTEVESVYKNYQP